MIETCQTTVKISDLLTNALSDLSKKTLKALTKTKGEFADAFDSACDVIDKRSDVEKFTYEELENDFAITVTEYSCNDLYAKRRIYNLLAIMAWGEYSADGATPITEDEFLTVFADDCYYTEANLSQNMAEYLERNASVVPTDSKQEDVYTDGGMLFVEGTSGEDVVQNLTTYLMRFSAIREKPARIRLIFWRMLEAIYHYQNGCYAVMLDKTRLDRFLNTVSPVNVCEINELTTHYETEDGMLHFNKASFANGYGDGYFELLISPDYPGTIVGSVNDPQLDLFSPSWLVNTDLNEPVSGHLILTGTWYVVLANGDNDGDMALVPAYGNCQMILESCDGNSRRKLKFK